MRTLQDLLPAIANGGNREAVRWTNGFRTLVSTYADLNAAIGAALRYLHQHDIHKGDRVLIHAENRIEWTAAFWACVASGAVAVPVDVGFSEDLVRRIESESRAKLILDAAALDEIASLPPIAEFRPAPVAPEDPVEIVYTSGTTGEPKGVTHRHRNICANLRPFQSEIEKYRKWARPFQPIRILNLLPLSHMFGQALGLYIPVLLGGAAVFTPEIRPAWIIRIIREHRISVAVGVPQIVENLKNEVERRFRVSPPARSILGRMWRFRKIHSAFGWKFWAIVAGGAPVDIELEEFWSRLGFLLIQGYGLTEASPVIAVNHPFHVRRGSLGKVLPGIEVKIAPDGEILVRGENITIEGGWLDTGDLGELDGEGRLYYRGRKKDTIVTSEGLNVHPEDVERVLDQFAEIRKSAVVGIRRNGGEQVHASVILNDANSDLEQLIRRANLKLESHQRIRSWSVWAGADFPRTPSTMKLRRNEIRRQLAEGVSEEAASQPKGKDLAAMSSLERVELLAELESAHHLDLDEEEFSKLRTDEELQQWIRRSAAADGEPAPLRQQRAPSEWARWLPVRAFRAAFQRAVAVPLFKRYLPLTVAGLDHLRDVTPPVIFAANHTSHLDAPAIAAALPPQWRRRLTPAMGTDMFEPYFHPERYPARQVLWTGLGYALALGLFNAYPLPHDLGGVRRALNYTGELIRRGYCPLVFPEGLRTPSGALQPFRPGIGMMTVRLRVPIVPVFIGGLYEVYSVHDSWPKAGAVRVAFGRPLRFSPDTTYEDAAQAIRLEIEALMT